MPALGPIDLQSPIRWSHPLNRGLASRHLLIPESGHYGGNTARDLTRRRDGTLRADMAWAARHAPDGSASLRFPGTTQSGVDLVHRTLAYPFTVAVWFSVDGLTRSHVLWWSGRVGVANWWSWYLAVSPAGEVSANSAVNNVFAAASGGSVTAGKWHRLVGVWESTTSRKVYLDGVLVATNTTSSDPTALTGTLWGKIGNSGAASVNSFLIGESADLVTVDRGWSAADVRADYDLARRNYPGVLNRRNRSIYLPSSGGGGTTVEESITLALGSTLSPTAQAAAGAAMSLAMGLTAGPAGQGSAAGSLTLPLGSTLPLDGAATADGTLSLPLDSTIDPTASAAASAALSLPLAAALDPLAHATADATVTLAALSALAIDAGASAADAVSLAFAGALTFGSGNDTAESITLALELTLDADATAAAASAIALELSAAIQAQAAALAAASLPMPFAGGLAVVSAAAIAESLTLTVAARLDWLATDSSVPVPALIRLIAQRLRSPSLTNQSLAVASFRGEALSVPALTNEALET